MRHRGVILVLLLLSACGAEDQRPSATVCELLRAPPSSPGTLVQVRARLRLDYHWGGISDDRCPDKRILLEGMEGGPSMSFCQLKFGCPANTEDYRIMGTFIGYYCRTQDGAGKLRLRELRDPERRPL